jgi:hypothetical protein
MHKRRSFVRLVLALAIMGGAALTAARSQPDVEPGVEPGLAARLDVSVLLAETGKPTPARVYLFKDGQPFRLSPVEALLPIKGDLFYRERLWKLSDRPKTLEVTHNGESHFILLDGQGSYDLPAGQYRLEAYHGMLHTPASADFTLKAGEQRPVKLTLDPIGTARQRAWLSADDHIHLMRSAEDNAVFLGWLQADDLTVGHFLQLQRQVDAAVQSTFGPDPASRRPGAEIRSGQESRSAFYGHINLLGGSRLLRPISIGSVYANSPEAYPFPYVVFEQGRALGATVGYAHFDGSMPHSTLPMDLALGSIDFTEVFQFGVLKKEAWYRLLNAGFRVTGVGGSDFPGNMSRYQPWPRAVPLLGPERTLVPGEPGKDNYERWAEGVRKGQAIVTNGPIVTIQVNGQGPGALVDWKGESTVAEGTAEAVSLRPIEILEVVANGEVVASAAGDALLKTLTLPFRVPIQASTWLAARVRTRHMADEPELWAHTNPVYVLRDRRPTWIKRDREDVARQWEKEIAYYRSAGLEFHTPAQRQELFDKLDQSLRILQSEPAPWPR